MKHSSLTALSCAVLMVAGLGVANAQGTGSGSGASPGSSPTPSAATGQCWDTASNTIKDNPNNAASGATSQTGTIGSGSGTMAPPSSGKATPPSGSAATRPPGMRLC